MESVKIAVKDLRSIRKEKTILVIMLLLFFVASFSSLIIIGLTFLYSPMGYATAKIGLVGNAPIFSSLVHPIRYNSLEKALEDFVNGKIDAVVVFNENVTGTNFITIYLPKEDIKAIRATLYLRRKLMEYQDVLRRIKGIPTLNLKVYEDGKEIEVPEGFSLRFRFIYVMLIPLLAVTTAIISSAFLIDSICEEIETGTLDVLLSILDLKDVIAGKLLASFILSVFLTIFWMVMLAVNGIRICNPALAMITVLSICFIMTAISLAISAFMMDREKSQLVFSIVAVSVIMLMFSTPISPIGLLVRISAGSSFSVIELTVYLTASLLAILLSLLTAEKRLNKSIGLEI